MPPPDAEFSTWRHRMNLVAASKRENVLFVAHHDHVGVYDTPTAHGVSEAAVLKSRLYRPFPDDNSEGYLSPLNVSPIPPHLSLFLSSCYLGYLSNN